MTSIMNQEKAAGFSELRARWFLRANLAVVAIAVIAGVAHAEIQNDLIGFSPNHVFESANAGENVDVLSGNLSLTIPLGPRFKLTDSLTYGVTLYYNAKIREYDCDPSLDALVHPCIGTLPPSQSYGLGFSLNPGRIYHHAGDYPYIYRVQLEDGSEHFFCDALTAPPANPLAYETAPAENQGCGNQSTWDSAHLQVARYSPSGGSSFQGWKVSTTDGRTIIFGNVRSSTTFESLVSRVQTAATRSNGTDPLAWVDYSYSSSDPYLLTQIADSQGRVITFQAISNGVAIKFPAFAGVEALDATKYATYTLRTAGLGVHNPSQNAPDQGVTVLTKIEYPGLDATTQSYRFEYSRAGETSYGWLLKRTLPTGASTDYYYEWYPTSKNKPYHTEMYFKTLTTGGHSYNWSWARFGQHEIRYQNQSGPDTVKTFSGSNPWQVRVLDPFDNMTVYNFNWTLYVERTQPSNGNCYLGECGNNWDDGLLADVTTYAGHEADSTHMIRRVEYEWDSDQATGVHKMFKYRRPHGGEYFAGLMSVPQTANSMAVNSRQVAEQTFSPGSGGGGGHTVNVLSSDWYGSVRPKQKDEYLDGVLYRTTHTEFSLDSGNYDAHKYVETKDASGNVVSRVDRKYTNGQIECEVVRNGPGHVDSLPNCATGSLQLAAGDVATVNSFDANTGLVTSITTQGGDDLSGPPRTVTLSYLSNPANSELTAILKRKNYGFSWNATNRDVDYNTGLTWRTNDPVGNTTRYQWDGLGRLTEIDPTLPEKPTIITYPSLLETDVKQTLTSSDFVESDYFYDDLGRLIRTRRRNAGGGYDVQKTEYDISGRVLRKSEWALDGTADADFKWTTYDYTIFVDPDPPNGVSPNHPDPLGRIHAVTTPDDPSPATPTTETTYDGTVTTVKVRDVRGWAQGADSNLVSTTVYTKDALGRLISVDSPSPGADAQYAYDENDKLVEVRLTDPAATTSIQLRRFEYDALGRLRVATNPENGTVEYTSYDSRGNLLSYKDARQNIFKMTYDTADRLLTRSQTVGGADLMLAQNTYDTGVGFTAGGSDGRLVEQNSYKVDGTVSSLVSRVRFGYGAINSSDACGVAIGGYNGLNGRLSWQKTNLQPWGFDIQTDYCQDAVGMPTTTAYPDRTGSGRTRTKTRSTYRNGYLLELDDSGRGSQYIPNVSYAAGGVPKEIDRVGSQDIIDLDVRNRPARIRSIGYSYVPPGYSGDAVSCQAVQLNPELYPAMVNLPCGDPEQGTGGEGSWVPYTIWDSGSYAYDMAGNVKTIGTEQYYYDALSRLVHASIPDSGSTHTLDFGFDAFGNMTSQGRVTTGTASSTSSRSYTLDWQTNRLQSRSWTIGGVTTATPYTYDESGNMTSEGGRGLVFDAEGRLREVMDPQKGQLGNYDYDASGFRVHSIVGGTETFVLRDASGQVLSEFQRPSGSTDAPVWNKDYIYALGKSIALVQNDIPTVPKNLRATITPVTPPTKPTQLTLTWDAPNEPDVVAYSLERRYKKTTTEVVNYYTISSPAHSYVDTFAATTVYLKYRLIAMDAAGNFSDQGPQLSVYPSQTSAPAAPPTDANGHSLFAVPGNHSVSLRWNLVPTPALDNIAGYRVERSTTSATGPWTILNTVPISIAEYLDTRLADGTQLANGATYWYHVMTVDTFGLLSAPSESVSATPLDHVPPGKLTDVIATPDRLAGKVIVTWSKGFESDIATYHIYRSTNAGSTWTDIGYVNGGQAAYTFPDAAATQGVNNYYTLKAFDSSGNVSDPSTPVFARPRHSSVGVPSQPSASFDHQTNGTTSTAGLPGDGLNNCDVVAEDDDDVRFVVQWVGASDIPEYHVYRKAPDETTYAKVAVLLNAGSTSYTFNDSAIPKGNYSYVIAGYKIVSGAWEESPGSTEVSVTKAFPSDTSVRNVVGSDGRYLFNTYNRESRSTIIRWSRVTEPQLVGYNVYRRCSFAGTNDPGLPTRVDDFACEPVWVRLNTAPIPPDTRTFEDSEPAGLQGGFFYAIRPVGPNGVEGKIAKVVEMNLAAGQWSLSGASTDLHCRAATTFATESLDIFNQVTIIYTTTIESMLNGLPNVTTDGINGQVHGSAGSDGPPPAPSSVMQMLLVKPGVQTGIGPYLDTTYAKIFWAAPASMPSDFLGYYVETAGSPAGPWQRLNQSPVAWWETQYVAQGVSVSICDGQSGHTQCLIYRVISVDTNGNESQPVMSAYGPSLQSCPMTPDPPANLRASNSSSTGSCYTRLDWDASPGAQQYIVYRMIDVGQNPFFYPTQYLPGSATSYVEQGDYTSQSSCPDHICAYQGVGDPCAIGQLDAFYVTAVGASGGESPRSNLVFWRCDRGAPYTRLIPPEEPLSPSVDDELLACMNGVDTANVDRIDLGAAKSGREGARNNRRESSLTPTLASAPMVRLGYADPPWVVLNLYTDHLGTVRAELNTATGAINRHNYFPFGEEITPTLGFSTHQYTGHERDRETGLDYMLARYYEAGLGRFISPDSHRSIGRNSRTPQRWNEYIYSANNPLSNMDPDGRDYVSTDAAFKAGMEFNRVSGSVTGNSVMNTFEANKSSPASGIVKPQAAWIVKDSKGNRTGTIEKQPGDAGPTSGEVKAKGGTGKPEMVGGASVTAAQTGGMGATAVYAGSQERSADASERNMPQGEFVAKEIVHETSHQNGGTEKQAQQNETAFTEEYEDASAGVNYSPATPLTSCSGCNK